jgi:hypothetical protein
VFPSGAPQETLVVPTADPTENTTITFDGLIFSSGGAALDPTTVPLNSGTADDLNPNAIGFGVRGGQASQLNQNEGFVAYDSAGGEINGLNFDIQGVGGIKTVNVEYWLVDEGVSTYGGLTQVNLTSGNTVVPFTIHSDESFDQVYVRFSYDTKPDTSGVRVENFEVELATLTPVETTVSEDLGAHIIFQDDGPSIGATQTDGIVDFLAGASTDVPLVDVSIGVDVPGEVYLTDIPDGWVYDDLADTTPNSATDPTGTFQVTVDNDSYTFEVLKGPVLTFESLDFSVFPSGAPQETLVVPTADPTENTTITFDGLIFSGGGAALDPTTIPLNSGTADDLNPNAIGFGVRGGQASQLNQNEGFVAYDSAGGEINGLNFDIQGVGGIKTVNVEYWLVDEGVSTYGGLTQVNLTSGNSVVPFTIHSDESFDQVYVRFSYDTKPDTSGVRVENFEVELPNPVPDQEFTFGITAIDADLDPSQETTFTVGVDGNNDGSILIV